MSDAGKPGLEASFLDDIPPPSALAKEGQFLLDSPMPLSWLETGRLLAQSDSDSMNNQFNHGQREALRWHLFLLLDAHEAVELALGELDLEMDHLVKDAADPLTTSGRKEELAAEMQELRLVRDLFPRWRHGPEEIATPASRARWERLVKRVRTMRDERPVLEGAWWSVNPPVVPLSQALEAWQLGYRSGWNYRTALANATPEEQQAIPPEEASRNYAWTDCSKLLHVDRQDPKLAAAFSEGWREGVTPEPDADEDGD